MGASKGFSAPRQGVVPEAGATGDSAYKVAVDNGYVGDEAAWLASLHGAAGTTPTLVTGAVTTISAGGSATASITGTAPNYLVNIGIPTGATGATPVITVGTVSTLSVGASATASFTGTALNLGLPTGATGATPTITIGAVTTLAAGDSATASFTGTALNLGLPTGPAGSAASATPLASTLPAALGAPAIGVSTTAARSDHVHTLPTIPVASSATPQALGSAAAGASADFSRADHVHAIPTIPSASSSTPIIEGVGAVGVATTYARGDHVHPAQTVPVAGSATPIIAGTGAAGVATAFSREDHVHPAQSITPAIGTPTSRTIAFATAYQATNTAKPAFVSVLIDCTATIALGSAQSNTCELIIGAANTVAAGTGTQADIFRNDLSVSILISVGFTGRQSLQCMLPAGYFFAVRRTSGTGMTVVSAYDQSIG